MHYSLMQLFISSLEIHLPSQVRGGMSEYDYG